MAPSLAPLEPLIKPPIAAVLAVVPTVLFPVPSVTAFTSDDEMESISISRHEMESVPVNSIKGSWGHTLGAAGIVETAALLHEMRESTLIKTVGFEELGVSKPINVSNKNQRKDFKNCLKLASGFGGSNAAMILQKV